MNLLRPLGDAVASTVNGEWGVAAYLLSSSRFRDSLKSVLPDLIIHCDWSTSLHKRWLTVALRRDRASYEVSSPAPVRRLDAFFSDLCERMPMRTILAGFDFPIGLPRVYAERAGITRFLDVLPRFGEGCYTDFYIPAEEARQISLMRPFYPYKPGNAKKQHLLDGLQLDSANDLLRACERSTPSRSRACELFWTLGANQVGKGAISGWRDLLAPALRKDALALWPFHGDLAALLESGRIVVVETYPGEIYSHLGLPRGFGKRTLEGRRNQAAEIRDWCSRNEVALGGELALDLQNGFGHSQTAEDKFDSLVGLLGMIEVVRDPSRFDVPKDPAIREVEGWILGMRAEPSRSTLTTVSRNLAGRKARQDALPNVVATDPIAGEYACPNNPGSGDRV
jgi:hypothetical protein